jgi:hypothetical protein
LCYLDYRTQAELKVKRASMPVHRECGQEVTWPNRNGWRGPLEYLGQTLTMREGAAVWVPHYKPHECDPAQVEAWRAEQDRAKHERKRRNDEHRRAWEERAAFAQITARNRDERWKIALKRDCPKCGVGPGEECLNLIQAARGRTERTRWPHSARVEPPPDPVPFDEEKWPAGKGPAAAESS